MSEPWLVDDFYSLSSSGSSNNSSSISPHFTPSSMYLSTSLSVLIPLSSTMKTEVGEICAAATECQTVPVGIAAWASRKMRTLPSVPLSLSQTSSSSSGNPMTHSTALPQILEGDYSTVYNKNGRIGIYTREERQSIISRFQDKRRNRVWKKKIRYHCRKNLADRRVRIKVSDLIILFFSIISAVAFSRMGLRFLIAYTLN